MVVLTEWKTQAEEQNTEARHTYAKALRSLRKYPLILKTGKECILLEGFGKKICEMLDKKLDDYKKGFTEDEWNELINEKKRDRSPRTSSSSSQSSVATAAGPSSSRPPPSPARKRKTSKSDGGGGYLPKFRSGGYALLITLLDHDGATKAVLIKEAQNLCDSSFTKKAGPDSFYTAWASMATLIKNKLVEKEGKPVRFKLTSGGLALAVKMRSFSEEDLLLFEADTPPLTPKPSTSTADDYFDDSAEGSASVQLRSDLIVSQASTSSSSVFGRTSSALPSQPRSSRGSSQDLPTSGSLLLSQPSSSSVFGRTLSSSSLPSHPSTSRGNSSKEFWSSSQPSSSQQSSERTAAPSRSVASSAINSGSSVDEPHETFFLFPGKFTIILLVDIHETEMQGKKRTDTTLQQLVASNIKAETRHLAVGDFVWIARDDRGVELTLPYVVERKRMDDMASSIKDGRFHEQKFRLRGCGLPNVIYLVEKYGNDSTRMGLPLQTLQQAAANSQIVDQFTLKFTQGFDDSIRYLACFTRQLVRIFKDKTLMSCAKNNLPEFDIQEDMMSLVTFKQFNKDSVKIKKWTIKEILIKQLIQMKGLSVDKAIAIAERYPTPAALISALTSAGSGEKLLADLPCSVKKIGPVIAKAVFQLYTMADLP